MMQNFTFGLANQLYVNFLLIYIRVKRLYASFLYFDNFFIDISLLEQNYFSGHKFQKKLS